MSLELFNPDAPASGDNLFGLPHSPENAAVVVIPVPFEATASYRRGTRGAPAAILEASKQVDLYDLETGEPWRAGIAMEPCDPQFETWDNAASEIALSVIAEGGCDPSTSSQSLVDRCKKVDEFMTHMNSLVYKKTIAILDRGQIPGILGGDHSVPFGAIQAAAERFPGLGILHVDAHADLRDAYEGFAWSHASIMHNVRTRLPQVGPIVQVGIRDLGQSEREFAENDPNTTTWFHPLVSWELAGGEPWRHIVQRMIAPLPEHVWISFDIDGLDPAFCPRTGTPVPGGLSWTEALVLLRAVGESGRKIIGFDLNEVSPHPEDEWDAIVGARLLYKLAGWAIATR